MILSMTKHLLYGTKKKARMRDLCHPPRCLDILSNELQIGTKPTWFLHDVHFWNQRAWHISLFISHAGNAWNKIWDILYSKTQYTHAFGFFTGPRAVLATCWYPQFTPIGGVQWFQINKPPLSREELTAYKVERTWRKVLIDGPVVHL